MADYNRNPNKNHLSALNFSNLSLFLSCGSLLFCIGPIITANLLIGLSTNPELMLRNVTFFLGICVYLGLALSTGGLITGIIAITQEKTAHKRAFSGLIISLGSVLLLLSLLLIGNHT